MCAVYKCTPSILPFFSLLVLLPSLVSSSCLPPFPLLFFSPPLWQWWTIICCFQVVCFFSLSIFLFAFSSKLYMLFPVTLWYTHTCHFTHLPISLQLSTEGGGGPFYKEPLYSSCLVNTSNSTCFKVCCKFQLFAMLLCTCNAYSFQVFDALAHLFLLAKGVCHEGGGAARSHDKNLLGWTVDNLCTRWTQKSCASQISCIYTRATLILG